MRLYSVWNSMVRTPSSQAAYHWLYWMSCTLEAFQMP